MKKQRKYDREFKLNAVKLYRESGKSLGKVSQDLGIPLATLAQWVRQFKEHGEGGFVGSGSLMPCNEGDGARCDGSLEKSHKPSSLG
ncbi:MAG: transposase [Chlamydiia bacterium]|nr:transposase [Chlamydiia bacterium]